MKKIWNAIDKTNYGITIHDRSRFEELVKRDGLTGVGDGYAEGVWDIQDPLQLSSVLYGLFMDHPDLVRDLELAQGYAKFALRTVQHLLERNTPYVSRENVVAHYDLDNTFYEQMLGRTMGYSCGIYDEFHRDLDGAQDLKFSTLFRELLGRHESTHSMMSGERIVEIGSGWGCLGSLINPRIEGGYIGLTLSDAQRDWCEEKHPLLEILVSDYRDHAKHNREEYDAAVSVEMIEHVGHAELGTYFSSVADMIKPGGKFVLQSILCQDRYESRVLMSNDFIKRRIFPGSDIPAPGTIIKRANEAGLQFEKYQSLPDYARTLNAWQANITNNPKVSHIPEKTLRLYHYYLAYCAAGFQSKFLQDGIFTFRKTSKL